ncbi:MAG TPA: DinB family protein [Chitinophagaceae bacterium]|nr:DinB family protein [Chitinophagaceae bacterium]
MLKRYLGLSLLAFLVITGLAGTVHNTAISKPERKTALGLLKESRNEVINSVKDLSVRQLNFKSIKDQNSVKQIIFQIAATEKNLWQTFKSAMDGQDTPDRRKEIKLSDTQLIHLIENEEADFKMGTTQKEDFNSYKSIQEALQSFKSLRAAHIKYMKSSTEDLRNHVVEMPFGYIDCYQLCLLMGAYSNYLVEKIERLKTDPRFPKS